MKNWSGKRVKRSKNMTPDQGKVKYAESNQITSEIIYCIFVYVEWWSKINGNGKTTTEYKMADG